MSSLRPGYEFVHGRNLLFVPYGVLGLARGASRELDAAFEPAVAPFLLRGLVEAVDERGAWVDHRRRTRNWWSRAAYKVFGAVKDCLFGEYKAAMQAILGKASMRVRVERPAGDSCWTTIIDFSGFTFEKHDMIIIQTP